MGQPPDTPNREYHQKQGRWISSDPGGLDAADPTRPQSWNRYSYVLNNPLSAVDPSGLWCVWDDGTGHDDDPDEGGFDHGECIGKGGHWNPTDTILNIWQSGGNITFMNVIGFGIQDISSAGMTLGQLDDMLRSAYNLMSPSDAKMNGEQCGAARTLLAREAKYGTSKTALMSAIGYGDETLRPFNSSNTAPTSTPVGNVKLDWYTNMQATGRDPSFGIVNNFAVSQ